MTSNIRTFTGLTFNPLSPEPDLIRIEDIAHALSMICRFTGHVSHFYSVAEHSIHVASLLPDNLKLAGLLHDASEAYISDISTPVKRSKYLTGYRSIERKLQYLVNYKFGISQRITDQAAVKRADKAMLVIEAEALFPGGLSSDWSALYDASWVTKRPRPYGMTPRCAELHFLNNFRKFCS